GFGEEELSTAARGLERLENAKFSWEHLLKAESVTEDGSQIESERIRKAICQAKEDFISGMEDDFNTPQALAGLYDLVREINRWSQEREFQLTDSAKDLLKEALNCLTTLGGEVLGLFEEAQNEKEVADEEIENLIASRAEAKKNKNWVLADQIRDELKNKGIIIEDTPQGVRWRRE
ncbi:MAG: DALR domain-containing protein, partial [Bacteroidota bacterium]